MSSGSDAEQTSTQKSAHFGDVPGGRNSYRVMLEDIASGIETTDSFAIKFSLLTKTPISKTKHIVNRLPAPIWTGEGRSRAEHILALIEEAGGKGSIVETGSAPSGSPAFAPSPAAASAAPAGPASPVKCKSACRWCGFPMKEGETRCGFCMTAIGDAEKSENQREPRMRAKAVSRKRLVCYAVALVVGVVLIEILIG
jgi:hypothetical protein